MEAIANTETPTKDSNFDLNIEVINRSQSNVKLVAVNVLHIKNETKNNIRCSRYDGAIRPT